MTTDTTPTLRSTIPLGIYDVRGKEWYARYSVARYLEFDAMLSGSHVRVRATLRDANLHSEGPRIREVASISGPFLSPAEWTLAMELAEDMAHDVAVMLELDGRPYNPPPEWPTETQKHDINLWWAAKERALQHLAAGAWKRAEDTLSAWVATYLELLCRRQDARAAEEWLEARAESAASAREDAAFQQHRDTH